MRQVKPALSLQKHLIGVPIRLPYIRPHQIIANLLGEEEKKVLIEPIKPVYIVEREQHTRSVAMKKKANI